jgi:hypothetical protein
MQLRDAESELWRRLRRWARATMTREAAEDFPVLRACQHNRRIKCFLAWIQEIKEEARLPFCLSLIDRHFELYLPQTARTPHLEAAFQEYHGACSRYHETLPPVPHCDRHAASFIRADPQRCAEAIVLELTSLCGTPRKLQKYRRGFTLSFGEWSLFTHAQVRPKDEMVLCFSFLLRSDAPMDWSETWLVQHWSSRIDPIMFWGVSASDFPLVGHAHEALCAQSLRASMSVFVPSVPKLIEGLEVAA